MIKIDISGSVKATEEIIVKATKEQAENMAHAILAEVQTRTPVKSGQARNGWHLEGGEDYTAVVNAVPYIRKLNDGHSKQAPAGFVEASVDSVKRRMK